MGRGRLVLLLGAGLLALGLVAGVRWLLGSSSGTAPGPAGAAARPEAGAPTDPAFRGEEAPDVARLAGRPDAGPRRAARSPPAATGEPSPLEEEPTLGGGIAAWLDVHLEGPEALLATGYVYALPAGAPGVSEVEHTASVDVGGERDVHLPLPAGGRWDVGWWWGTGSVLVEDVEVAAGGREGVEIRAPPLGTIRVVGPAAPAHDAPDLAPAIQVQLQLPDPWPQPIFPGRGQRAWCAATSSVALGGETVLPNLPVGTRWQVYAWPLLATGGPYNGGGLCQPGRHPGWQLRVEPEEVEVGGEVRLRFVELGVVRIHLALRGTPPASWTAGGLRPWLGVELDLPGARSISVGTLLSPDGSGFVPDDLGLGVAPGSTRVRLQGVGYVLPDPVPLEVVGGRVTETTIEVAIDEQADLRSGDDEEGGEEVAVEVTGAGVAEEDRELAVAAVRSTPGEADELDGTVVALSATGEGDALDPAWREVGPVVARVAPDLVSEPTPVPARGPLRLALVRGGWLVVVPDRLVAAGLGVLRLRRADGAPFWRSGWPDAGEAPAPDAVLAWAVEPGSLLGPFPPGEVRFEVRLGQVRLPDVVARVAAGRVGVVEVRLR